MPDRMMTANPILHHSGEGLEDLDNSNSHVHDLNHNTHPHPHPPPPPIPITNPYNNPSLAHNDQNNNPNSNGNGNNDEASRGIGIVAERRDFFEEIRNGGGHWSQLLRQVILHLPSEEEETKDDHVPIEIQGGSENGQFTFIGDVNVDVLSPWIAVGYVQLGDIILDIQGQQVAGYTQSDVISLLQHCLRASSSATLTVAPRGSLGPELRSYLNTRFQKGSVDHALQGVVRDNLYLRTVPVTTRPPRPGEIHDVDYTFLSIEEFMELERNGSLLESGVYAGNHYGTPKPYANRPRTQNNNSSIMNNTGVPSDGTNKGMMVLPGLHPSSEGKRRRNRSNVEALGAGGSSGDNGNDGGPPPITYSPRYQPPGENDELGPLPSNWEMAYTEKGEVYFIDHNTGTSHWLDPRLSRVQKMSLEECDDNELPFGWERIDDPHYGTYFIDHVNRRTQFENPVIQAKQAKAVQQSPQGTNEVNANASQGFMGQTTPSHPPRYSSTNPPPPNPKPSTATRFSVPRGRTPDTDLHPNHSSGGLKVKTVDRQPNRFFTRDPTQLIGERIGTTLVKSSRGLGFTIVGGDDDDGLDEFLQIKSVVADGPAWRDGKLRTGDVLVRVNGRCVLGYTHQEMVSIFQSIAPGEEVHLEVCRGYPLPFDPSDPNTEIVTTVAVAPVDLPDKRFDWNARAATPDSVAHSAHSLPELHGGMGYGGSGGHKPPNGRPASVDLLLDSPTHPRGGDRSFSPKHVGIENGTFLTVNIVKGTAGFGFTIADSVNGQKVKKVLDPTHCGGLEEGDRLIAIDGIDLRGLSHTQVVQILKDFPLGRDASLTIQRVHSHTFYGKRALYSPAGECPSRPAITGLSPRSKTPTAELGRPRIRDTLPERPKTPLQFEYNGNPQMPNSSSFIEGDLSHHQQWMEMTIDLQRRQEGFGFRIIGGTEEGSQVSVGHIVPRGAAALDGRLQTNDQIIAVDGVSVLGASHHSVVQLMARAAANHRVRLTIRRPIYNESTTTPSQGSPGYPQAPLHVVLKRQPAEGFGFVIISSASKAGATIGRIVEGSPADRCGLLHVGDRILAVNQTDISQLHHSQVVQLIKDSGLMLTLSVLQVPNHQGPQISPNNANAAMLVGDLENLSFRGGNQGYDMGTAFINPESQPINFGSNYSGSSSFPENMDQVFTVQLNRGQRGFGFSIRGGKEFQNMPLFVLRLAEDGPAALDGHMQIGDQILQINGINTQGMTHSQAIHLIKTGGATVHLLLRRGSVPIPYLSQMPNFPGVVGFMNGHEEIQSISSNNDAQFVGHHSPVFRDHTSTPHHPYHP